MDRWSIVSTLNYLPHEDEVESSPRNSAYDTEEAVRRLPAWSAWRT